MKSEEIFLTDLEVRVAAFGVAQENDLGVLSILLDAWKERRERHYNMGFISRREYIRDMERMAHFIERAAFKLK